MRRRILQHGSDGRSGFNIPKDPEGHRGPLPHLRFLCGLQEIPYRGQGLALLEQCCSRSGSTADVLGGPPPWGVIPLSPRTRGEIVLEAVWRDGHGARIRQLHQATERAKQIR